MDVNGMYQPALSHLTSDRSGLHRFAVPGIDAGFTMGVAAMDTLSPRRFAPEFKRERVERTLQPGAPVAGIALAHQINANQLFKWRRQYLKDRKAPSNSPGPTLLPVAMTPWTPHGPRRSVSRRVRR
jgi:transposase-like protein